MSSIKPISSQYILFLYVFKPPCFLPLMTLFSSTFFILQTANHNAATLSFTTQTEYMLRFYAHLDNNPALGHPIGDGTLFTSVPPLKVNQR